MLVILDAAYVANGLGLNAVLRFQNEGVPVALCGDPRDMNDADLESCGTRARAAACKMASEPTTASVAEAIGSIVRDLGADPLRTLVISGRGEFMAAAIVLRTRFAWPLEML
jgi:NAD(P)-dependent dehydrogenase (short-subunit alcohol dehydrogenase family)